MRKCEKKRIKRIRTHEKACKLAKKIRRLSGQEEVDLTNGPLSHWYEVLSKLKSTDTAFIAGYKARDGHLFAVHVFREALSTLCLERTAQLEQERR